MFGDPERESVNIMHHSRMHRGKIIGTIDNDGDNIELDQSHKAEFCWMVRSTKLVIDGMHNHE